MNWTLNESIYSWNSSYGQDEYIFDRTDVRAIFILLYTIVFCLCFFGNLLVILVVTITRRLRTTTNLFLANLAVADLCVGVFCVFQNLSIYLIPTWVFGDFLCKMYQFVHSLSYTASIFILVVICTERYFAIMHPITCKQILTTTRLKITMASVWLVSAIYSAPRFVYVRTIDNSLQNGQTETICIIHRQKYNSKIFDIINFVLLYVTPLCVMCVLYTVIAVRLWNSSVRYVQPKPSPHVCTEFDMPDDKMDKKILEAKEDSQTHLFKNSLKSNKSLDTISTYRISSRNIWRARRGVVRMLIIVVLTFAAFNLPFHARKMWQYWSSDYEGTSMFSSLFTPLTFLMTFMNSAINPMLYAFLSKNIRSGIKELFRVCRREKSSSLSRNNAHNSSFGKSCSEKES